MCFNAKNSVIEKVAFGSFEPVGQVDTDFNLVDVPAPRTLSAFTRRCCSAGLAGVTGLAGGVGALVICSVADVSSDVREILYIAGGAALLLGLCGICSAYSIRRISSAVTCVDYASGHFNA